MIIKPFVLITSRVFFALSFFLGAHLSASVVELSSPDIIEISVIHLNDVQNQMREGLGISWGPQEVSVVPVQIGSSVQNVQLTRVYSVSSYPYIELIQAVPQIGPWAEFNDATVGLRPRSTLTWRIADANFADAKSQMDGSGMTKTADGSNFVYYESTEGVQLQIISEDLAPDPVNGIANTPPDGLLDFGAMSYISIPLRPNPLAPGLGVPVADSILRTQISAATGGGVKWDIIVPIYLYLPYIQDSNPAHPVYLNNPFLRYSCNAAPFINLLVINPPISPFGATANSTTFSHAWVPAGSGFDPAGTAITDAYENQLFAAGYVSELRLDAQSVLPVLPYSTDFLRYFVGIDNVNIQVVSTPGSNITSTCKCEGSGCF